MSKGYIYGVISAILFGSAGLIVKIAFMDGIDPVGLLTLQYVIAIFIMFSFLMLVNRKALKVSKKNLLRLVILGGIGNTGMTVLYYTAFTYLPIAMVTILLYTSPIMVFIYLTVFGVRKLEVKKLIAVLIAFSGCILTLGLFQGGLKYSLKGIIIGILCAAFYAFMNVYSERKLTDVEPLVINAYATLFSLFVLILIKFPYFLFNGQITSRILNSTIVLALFCEIIPLTMLYAAIKYIGSVKVSIIGNLEIPTAMILAYIFYKEPITIPQIIGVLLVVYAVYSIRK